MTFSLGEFDFVTASRAIGEPYPPLVVSETSELRQRPGVDGIDLRKNGRKGVPFEWFSFVDCDDLQAAADLFAEYKQIEMSGSPVELVYAGINYRPQHNTVYYVLYVEALAMQRLVGATGGLSADRGAYLRCRWELLPAQAE